jgi:flagellar biosynthesis/type III secretory pathway protein FliH
MYDKKEEVRKLLKSLIDAQAKGELWSRDVIFDLFDKTYDEGYKDGYDEGLTNGYDKGLTKGYDCGTEDTMARIDRVINSLDICPKCGNTKGEGL